MSSIIRIFLFLFTIIFFSKEVLCSSPDTAYLINTTGRKIFVRNMTFFLKGSFPLILSEKSLKNFKVLVPYKEYYTSINLSLGNGEFSDFFLQAGVTYNVVLNNKGQIYLQTTDAKINQHELKFFSELTAATGSLNFYKIKTTSWNNNKDRHLFIESLYVKRVAFLNNYHDKYPLSGKFFKLADLFLKSRFIVELFQMKVPNDDVKKGINIFYKDSIKKYIEGFSYDEAMGIMDVRYASYLLFQAHQMEESKSSQTIFLDSFVSGKMKDFLLGKYLAQKMNDRTNEFTSQYKERISSIKDDYIQSIVNEYSNVSVINLQKDTAGIYVMDAGLKRVSFNDVISSIKAKIFYIDFWASWCAPCIKEMPNSIKLRKQFEGNPDIAFLYISVDEDYQNWLTAAEQNKLKAYKFSYKVLEESNFTFIKTLKISSYPRYLLINRDGKILVPDAKRPGNPALVSELKKILESE